MKINKRFVTGLLALILLGSTPVYADVVPGDAIVSLGANLTKIERQTMLDEFRPPEDALYIEVTNAEEHEYLGNVIPASQIGTKAISSAMVTYEKSGSGIDVELSDHIRYITPDTYRNALVTAGITDASIKVSSPVDASGTAALTGILKGYETLTGENISEDIKKIANEEMVISSEITESIGSGKTSDLINTIKVEIADKMPESEEEVRVIINNVVNNYNIQLSDEQIEKLVGLFTKMQNANIDWDKVKSQAEKYSQKAADYLSSEEGQGLLQKIKSGFNAIIDWISDFFQE